MPDYSKGLIYKITTPNGLYVGSCCDFKKREQQHRSNLHNEKIRRTYNLKLYRTIRENNGAWKMEKIKDFPCENDIELRKEETKVMLELNANLNGCRAYTSVEEMKEHKKEYREANKAQRKEYSKEHYQANKEQKKEYYQANKEHKKEYNKQYHQANKEQIRKQSKVYYESNREQILEKVECECGCKISRHGLTGHRKTKKHLKLMSNKQNII